MPDVPRPSIDNDVNLKADFVANWVLDCMDEYLDEIDEGRITAEDIKQTQLFADIISEWDWDDMETATKLVRFHGWCFAKALNIYEGNMSGEAREYQRKLDAKWVTENGYVCPFEQGTKVRWVENGVTYTGTIKTTAERFLDAGYCNVQTEEFENAAKAIAEFATNFDPKTLGHKVEWENLEVIDD
ncbi:hypothetical protein K7G91_000860 [Pasteurella canis]|uniref:hypothetical protein n=1 Tax=Pasteurella canis TaxID=753 RepID=UPI001D1256FA|nr:hypothetical protein [Pasteurella canis]UDW84575.1 hypothetical protein K7G91_000860 [Pasteurella canis]